MFNIVTFAQSFLSNTKGNIGVMAAVTFLPLAMIAGIALDFTNIKKEEQRLQDALDAATMSGVLARADRRPDWSSIRSVYAFLENSGYERARPNNRSNGRNRSKGDDQLGSSNKSVKLTKHKYTVSRNDVTLSTKATSNYKPAFASIIGKSNVELKAETTVTGPRRLSSVRFIPTFGSGYLDKTIKLYVNRPDSTRPELLATYEWESTAPITLPSGNSPGRLRSFPSGWVELGNYTDFFLSFSVRDDWNTYRPEQLDSIYGGDHEIFSYENNVGEHFYVDGQVLPEEAFVDFSRYVTCQRNRPQKFEFEDAPGISGFGTDFRFDVIAKCDGIDTDRIRIAY
jgi:Flp pilus assembly protein TadG